jgi:hypothetical protein
MKKLSHSRRRGIAMRNRTATNKKIDQQGDLLIMDNS